MSSLFQRAFSFAEVDRFKLLWLGLGQRDGKVLGVSHDGLQFVSSVPFVLEHLVGGVPQELGPHLFKLSFLSSFNRLLGIERLELLGALA